MNKPSANEEKMPGSDKEFGDPILGMRTFTHSLPMALLSSREAVMRKFRPLLRKYELTEQQWRVLRALIETNNIEVTELARQSFILSPSLSRILQNLISRRLITRHVVASDQRRSHISITPKGRTLFRTIAPQSENQYQHIESAIGRDKLNQLYDLLAELEASLRSADLTQQ